ncbi:MAG: hypothetical protein HY580_02845 [Nitrospinae bacterium]|nr:hypothetical protein [Nitrospinota bacterium]
MFYEVRILDPKGKIKRVLTSKELSKRYWQGFKEQVHGQVATSLFKGRGRKSRKDSYWTDDDRQAVESDDADV